MKVDFKGLTTSLQRLYNGEAIQNTTRSTEGAVFSELLGDVDPNYQNIREKRSLDPAFSTEALESTQAPFEPRARYSFPAPDLMPPELAPNDFPHSPEETPTGDVKIPTVVSVKRRPSSEALLNIPRQERIEQVSGLVKSAGVNHGVDPVLGMAVVAVESSFNPRAISSDGHFSKGLFQLLDSTAKTILDRDGLSGKYSPFEPTQNVDLGVRYLRYLHDLFTTSSVLPNGATSYPTANSSDLEKLAVAAFNAGEGRVASSQAAAKRAGKDPGVYSNIAEYLPESTREYVKKVLAEKDRFQDFGFPS